MSLAGICQARPSFTWALLRPGNKVKFRSKSKAVVFALAGNQHREQLSLPNQGWELLCSLLSNHIQFGPGHLLCVDVTFLLAVVVMARPLGSSRAVLCFFISCTDTTGITTCRAGTPGWTQHKHHPASLPKTHQRSPPCKPREGEK